MIEERLAWEFESAPVREQLRLRKRQPLPFEREVLDREPRRDETVADLIQALDDLGTCRQIGMDVGPIPITAIWAYWQIKGYDPVAVEILTRATRRGDDAFRAERAKKAAKP